MYHSNMLKFK